MALIERKIRVTLELGAGADGQTPGRQVTIENHRASVNVRIAGGVGMGQAEVRIYGLSLSLMNQFSTIGLLPLVYRRNVITIEAGDDERGMAAIFKGTIQNAWADMLGAPEVAFTIQAFSGLIEAVTQIEATSYPGGFDVAEGMKVLADKMSLAFEDNGVHVTQPKSYFRGSAREQAACMAREANINWIIDNGTLAIWPKGGARSGTTDVSPKTGMVGYPTFTGTGIVVTTPFDPTIRFGASVTIHDTAILPARGTWNVVTLVHDIEAQLANGKWFTQAQLVPPGYIAIA